MASCQIYSNNINWLYQVKDGNGVSGADAKTCPFYDELDAILGTRAASSPPVLLDSGGSSVIAAIDSETQDEGKCQH